MAFYIDLSDGWWASCVLVSTDVSPLVTGIPRPLNQVFKNRTVHNV